MLIRGNTRTKEPSKDQVDNCHFWNLAEEVLVLLVIKPVALELNLYLR
jgi:hypothetical protein